MAHAQITTDHLNEALKSVAAHADGQYSVVDVFNKAQELADKAQAQPEPKDDDADFITRLNSGLAAHIAAVFGTNPEQLLPEAVRKVDQPEPVEPHAALRADPV